MKLGRPTKYTDEMPAKVDEYLAECKVWWDEFHKTRGEKSDTYERVINVKLPMVEGFAEYIDVTKSTLYEWAKEHKDFSNALDRIIRQQHNMLAQGGVAGYFNPVITKLMLSNNHGYKEKTDVTTNGKALPAPIISLDAILGNNQSQEDSQPEE